jgi:hypothetical protein
MPRRRENGTNYRRDPAGYQGLKKRGRQQYSLPREEEDAIRRDQSGTAASSSPPAAVVGGGEGRASAVGGVIELDWNDGGFGMLLLDPGFIQSSAWQGFRRSLGLVGGSPACLFPIWCSALPILWRRFDVARHAEGRSPLPLRTISRYQFSETCKTESRSEYLIRRPQQKRQYRRGQLVRCTFP